MVTSLVMLSLWGTNNLDFQFLTREREWFIENTSKYERQSKQRVSL